MQIRVKLKNSSAELLFPPYIWGDRNDEVAEKFHVRTKEYLCLREESYSLVLILRKNIEYVTIEPAADPDSRDLVGLPSWR